MRTVQEKLVRDDNQFHMNNITIVTSNNMNALLVVLKRLPTKLSLLTLNLTPKTSGANANDFRGKRGELSSPLPKAI